MYCIALAVGIVFNCVFAGLEYHDIALEHESQEDAERIVEFNASAQQYRPVGAVYMCSALTVAWVGASEQSTKDTARLLLADYAQDFSGSRTGVAMKHLEWMNGRLRLVC